MNILVLGHSDSAGDWLEDRTAAWPALLQGALREALGRDVTLEHRAFEHLRRDAVATLEAALAGAQPDLVVLALNPYAFAMPAVSFRVRERFGSRAARLYLRWERRFMALTQQGHVRSRLNRGARRVARRMIGVRAFASYEAVIAAYADVLRALARHERLHVLVMGGNRFTAPLRAANPGMLERLDQFARDMEAAAVAHRFAWFNTEASVAGPQRDTYFLADGVHRTLAAHARLAGMLLPVVRALVADEAFAVVGERTRRGPTSLRSPG